MYFDAIICNEFLCFNTMAISCTCTGNILITAQHVVVFHEVSTSLPHRLPSIFYPHPTYLLSSTHTHVSTLIYPHPRIYPHLSTPPVSTLLYTHPRIYPHPTYLHPHLHTPHVSTLIYPHSRIYPPLPTPTYLPVSTCTCGRPTHTPARRYGKGPPHLQRWGGSGYV